MKIKRVMKTTAMASIGCCLVVSLAGCQVTATGSVHNIQNVVVDTVGKSSLKKAKMAVGRVMGDTESAIMSKISGRAIKVNGEIGQEVKAGQPLIVLDDRDYSVAVDQAMAGLRGAEARLADVQNGTRSQQMAQIQQRIQSSKATLDNTKENLDRTQSLFDQGAVPQSQLDAAKLAYTQAQSAYQQVLQDQSLAKEGATKETLENLRAAVEQSRAAVDAARLNKSNTVITAPISGKIAALNIHPGETVAPGIPLITLVSSVPVVEAYVPEDQINNVKVGQMLKVRIEQVSSQAFDAKVLAISPISNSSSKEYPVKLSLPGDPNQWKSGMYAEVTLPSEKDTIVVPDDAIVKRGTERLVMVTDGKIAMTRPVVVGASDGSTTEILSGLKAGEKVIVVGQDELKDGDPVQVYFAEENSK